MFLQIVILISYILGPFFSIKSENFPRICFCHDPGHWNAKKIFLLINFHICVFCEYNLARCFIGYRCWTNIVGDTVSFSLLNILFQCRLQFFILFCVDLIEEKIVQTMKIRREDHRQFLVTARSRCPQKKIQKPCHQNSLSQAVNRQCLAESKRRPKIYW